MSDGFSLVCPACGQGADLSAGLTPNENGQLICASCGGEIPIPLAAPDESLGDTTTSAADLPTVVDPQHMVHPAGADSIESMLGDCGSGRYDEQETIGKGGNGNDDRQRRVVDGRGWCEVLVVVVASCQLPVASCQAVNQLTAVREGIYIGFPTR